MNKIGKIIAVCLIVFSIGCSSIIDSARAYNWDQYGSFGWFKRAHNWVVLNALELLKKDGYDIEAGVVERFLEDVINGVTDADTGSAGHGRSYGIPERNLYDLTDMGGTGLDGGGLAHFFDPWTHQGLGIFESPWLFNALYSAMMTEAGEVLLLAIDIIREIEGWRSWFGRNAAEGAERALKRAIEAWKAGDQEKALYFLGYVLHVVADVTVPHHAACVLLDGHKQYEDFVDSELQNVLPDNLQAALYANTIYNIGENDHGIYLEDLPSLSDGIYIAGDTDKLTYTGSEIEGLKRGHIHQLPNPVYQFIDFAAHETIEWYPLANDGDGWVDFDNWWEIYNYIEAPNLRKKRKGTDWEDNHDSRLIFHFEGVDAVVADFEGATHNYEAIDMENWYGKDLGYVVAYDDYWPYDENLVGGPWVDEGWLYGGPEPQGRNTLQLQTVVYRGLNTIDPDCDGWQLSEIRVDDRYSFNGPFRIYDPLLFTQPSYVTSDYRAVNEIPRLDDPLSTLERPERIAAVHLTDLASKLCAGIIKYFFDEVDLPRARHPETYIRIRHMEPVPGLYIGKTYMDEYGNTYFNHVNLELVAIQGRTVWDGTKYVLDTDPSVVGKGLSHIYYQIDGGSWHVVPSLISGGIVVVYSFPQFTYSYVVPINLPDDELPHTIRYYSENQEGQVEPMKTQVFIQDKTPPTVEVTFGEPSKLVGDKWYITRETPIIINSVDTGSGICETRFSIAKIETVDGIITREFVVGKSEYFEDMKPYEGSFTFGGIRKLLKPPIWTHSSPFMYKHLKLTTVYMPPLPLGNYHIYYLACDNVDNRAPLGDGSFIYVEVEVVDSIEGLDVQIDPYGTIIQPGSSFVYNVSISNRYPTTETYDLTLEGLDPAWFTLSQTSVTLDPKETANISLTISPPYAGVTTGTYTFTVTATLQGSHEVSDTTEVLLILAYDPEIPSLPEGGLSAAVLPKLTQAIQGTTLTLNIRVINNQNFDDLVRVKISDEEIPARYRLDLAWFSWIRRTVFIPAGGSITIPLTITIPAEISAGYKFFKAIATSATQPDAKAVDAGIIRVTQIIT